MTRRGDPILTLRVPQTTIDALRKASEALNIPMSQIVRDAIASQLSWMRDLPKPEK